MSYILDALKKSEAERSARDDPEYAHRVPFAPTPRKRREIWPYLLMLALVANAFVIVVVVWPQSGPENAAVASGEPSLVQREQSQASATTSAPPESAAEEGVESPEAPEPVAAQERPSEVSSSPPMEAIGEIPDINAMPRSVQRRVPQMSFNGHVYSSNPSSRRVMINNRMLQEGDRVDGLVIQEITAPGVVFRLDEHVFQIGIVRDWKGAL